MGIQTTAYVKQIGSIEANIQYSTLKILKEETLTSPVFALIHKRQKRLYI